MQNFGVLLIVMQAVFAWVLKRAQYGVYWFWWLQIQNVKPDERQVAVRQRVFVRAYGTAVILMVLFSQGAIQAFVHYANPARDDLIARALWALGIFLISLPSILAAWEKDS